MASRKTLLALRPDAQEALSEQEQLVLQSYIAREGSALPLSPVLQANLYNLFLNGKTCEQISTLNQGISQGAVLLARVENEWDLRKKEYTRALIEGVSERAKQIQLESVHFVADYMSAFHKKFGSALQEYLQSGKETTIDRTAHSFISGQELRNYKLALEMLKEATGQTERKTVSGEILHIHEGATPEQIEVTDDNAEDFLKLLDKKKTAKALKDKNE
jgi:hypothetical protein